MTSISSNIKFNKGDLLHVENETYLAYYIKENNNFTLL
jgi:hypothetical protein